MEYDVNCNCSALIVGANTAKSENSTCYAQTLQPRFGTIGRGVLRRERRSHTFHKFCFEMSLTLF